MNGRVVPELRTDWLTGRTVILAEHRANRPTEFAATTSSLAPSLLAAAACPFCPGHESQTPAAVDSRADEQGHWRVRVVPNMYPAVMPQHDAQDTNSAVGAHEVVIESARHVDRTSSLTVPEFSDVLAVYAARLGHWHDKGSFEYGLVFKNVGPWAGASLSHLHSQLIALPKLPPVGAPNSSGPSNITPRMRRVRIVI